MKARAASRSTYEFLEMAQEIEAAAERLYRVLAGRFGGEAKALFLRLAEEEVQHAARIRLLAARYRHDKVLAGALTADWPLLELLLAEALEAVGNAEAGAWDGAPEAALAGAVELEKRFCEVHAQVLARDGHPELKAFFEQLAAQDRAHHELLAGQGAPAAVRLSRP